MNDVLLGLGLIDYKHVVGILLLPPVPLLALTMAGVLQLFKRPLLGGQLVVLALLGFWLTSTTALSRALTLGPLKAPPALTAKDVGALKAQPRTAIVVLGGGRQNSAPEYGTTTLNGRSLERLRYGIWLSRQTALPVAFSGGIAHASLSGPTEAELAGRIASQEFRAPLRWLENRSRDTHENALRSVALLGGEGIDRIVLVTHAYHMRRALRNFQNAAQARPEGRAVTIIAAPIARPTPGAWKLNDWLPSLRGMEENYLALHELLGLLAGA